MSVRVINLFTTFGSTVTKEIDRMLVKKLLIRIFIYYVLGTTFGTDLGLNQIFQRMFYNS